MAEEGDNSAWSGASATQLAIGEVLLATSEPMTAFEIAADLGDRDPSRIRKVARQMVIKRLLSEEAPRPDAKRLGRPPKAAFSLVADQRARLERAIHGRSRPPRGGQLVFAEATGDRTESLLDVLSNAELMAKARWWALCDGDRQEYVIAFDADSSHQPMLELTAVLSAAKIGHRRASLSPIRPARELVAHARRARAAARRASASGETRDEG